MFLRHSKREGEELLCFLCASDDEKNMEFKNYVSHRRMNERWEVFALL